MRDLMTHTAGWEETIQDIVTFDASSIGTLRNYLATHFPAQIFRPGKVAAYSNYGAALAGYIVYLKKVRQALASLAQDEREEIIRELRSHLLDRQAQGRDNVLDGFETPERFAAAYVTESALR